MNYIINIDGACKGNPGVSGIGITFKDDSGVYVSQLSKNIGITTNNVAEYTALFEALKQLYTLEFFEPKGHILIKSDSLLLVNQMKGLYRVNAKDIKKLYFKSLDLISKLQETKEYTFEFNHIFREFNQEADSLASEACYKAV